MLTLETEVCKIAIQISNSINVSILRNKNDKSYFEKYYTY